MNKFVFIYDRTQADVDRVKELRSIGWVNLTDAQKAEWLGGLKGSLNTADLQRIENNVYSLSQLLEVSLQSNKDNIPEIPGVSYFNQLIVNLEALIATGFVYLTTPEVPQNPINTFQKVNDIEKILRDIYSVYVANSTSSFYCGEAYAGEYGLI